MQATKNKNVLWKNSKNMNKKKQLGNAGEDMVALTLKSQGFTLQHKNYRKRYGEIDLIAQKDDLLIFVEVKRRKKQYFALEQLITWSKQQKIIKVAKEYIARYNCDQMYCRFDVALIVGDKLTYIPNAFMDEG